MGWAVAKSLTATEEGYLIAFNGLKRVAHVEKYFRDVLWTAGNTGDNDHVLAGESALRQLRFAHYEQNKLFAIDVPALADMSGERGAELLVHPIGKSQSSPWRFRPEEPLLGVSGGSIKLVGEKILAYLPAMDAGYDYIFEIDPNTRKAITQIRVGNAYSWPGTRLHSGHTLGAEQYLGERPTLVH